jgi:DNA-binding NtrC family response regulator
MADASGPKVKWIREQPSFLLCPLDGLEKTKGNRAWSSQKIVSRECEGGYLRPSGWKMKDKLHKILVVDDDLKMCELLSDILKDEGFSVTTSRDSLKASGILNKEEFDVILTDLKMHGMDGIDLLDEAKRAAPLTPVIIMTAFGTIETAIKAMKMGAYDYVLKSDQTDELVLTVKKALEHRLLKKEIVWLKKRLESESQFHHLIGKSPSMKKVYETIEMISDASCNILITGESGTGKELVAKAIHDHSNRKEGPFVAVNCAAVPETIIESELFGYKKGAFTDAKSDKKGLIFEADEGTLFLDEITEMPPTLQAKLLRVIEEKEVRPLGDTVSYLVDLRIISTSNRDLKSFIQEGKFREDLYYRMKVIDIELPPLRERKEDIPLLVQHFIHKFGKELKKKISTISEDALKALLDYSWPGNVRELENVIQRAMILGQHETLLSVDFPDSIIEQKREGDILEKAVQERYSFNQLLKEYIKKMMIETGGNKTEVSKILEIDRKTLYRKMKKL